jgi:hypothetical protein
MGYKYRPGSEGVKVSLTRSQAIILITVLVATLAIIYVYIITKPPQPITTVEYYGNMLTFRENLIEANNITVSPSDKAISDAMTNSRIENITIVFKNTTDLSYTAVQAFEITYKLRIQHLVNNRDIAISAKEVDSLDNITGTAENPMIVLIPPSIANDTYVALTDNTVRISGKTYKDYNLATIKFLIVTLGIKI